MDRVCCIMDLDGFDTRVWHQNSYRTEFLVREFGYVRIDPAYHYMPRSYRFDLRHELNLDACTDDHQRTLQHQSRHVIGMSILPSPDEKEVLPYERLNEFIVGTYDLCRRIGADTVAFKGGVRERRLLEQLDIPWLDLEHYCCPSYKTMVEQGKMYSTLKDCGQHKLLKQGQSVLHCPLAEVTAYRDWYMLNFRRFSPGNI